MRFRLTLFLLILNAALFFGIWSLERSDSEGGDKPHASIAFSVLQIEGKNIEKPRILKLENNRWRIVSPIDWPANLFAEIPYKEEKNDFPGCGEQNKKPA